MSINIESEVHGNRSGERKIIKIGPNLNLCYTMKTLEIIHLCTDLWQDQEHQEHRLEKLQDLQQIALERQGIPRQSKWSAILLITHKIHQPLVCGRLIFPPVVEKAQATTTKPWLTRLSQIRSFFTAKDASSPVKKWPIRYSSENELICRMYREFKHLNF